MKPKRRSLEKKDRNQEILEDYNDSMLISDMEVKHGISKQRIFQILKRFETEEK